MLRQDEAARETMGKAALAFSQASTGATENMLAMIQKQMVQEQLN